MQNELLIESVNVNIKYEKFVFIISELIKWPTVQAVINNIVLFTFLFYNVFQI